MLILLYIFLFHITLPNSLWNLLHWIFFFFPPPPEWNSLSPLNSHFELYPAEWGLGTCVLSNTNFVFLRNCLFLLILIVLFISFHPPMKSPSTRSNRPSCPCWWAPSQVSRGLKDQPLGFTYLHILNNLMYFLISCRVKTSEFSFPLPRTDTVIEGCCIHLQKDQISQERIRAIVYKINTVNRIDKTYTTKGTDLEPYLGIVWNYSQSLKQIPRLSRWPSTKQASLKLDL